MKLGIVLCTGIVLFLSSLTPALAANSSPTEAEASLNQIQQEAKKTAESDEPRSLNTMRQKTEGDGLNAVQGSADKEKMKNPENSENVETVTEMVDKKLKNVFGN
ncbi:MAG: hypothetical protein ACP5D7_00740 [Limnospira sp.]